MPGSSPVPETPDERECEHCDETNPGWMEPPWDDEPCSECSDVRPVPEEAVMLVNGRSVDWRTALYDALSGVNTDAGAVVIDFEELCKDPAYHREDVRADGLASEVEEAREALQAAETFVETVTRWTGTHEDEKDEALASIRAALDGSLRDREGGD